jgi:hypothetical protein
MENIESLEKSSPVHRAFVSGCEGARHRGIVCVASRVRGVVLSEGCCVMYSCMEGREATRVRV